MLEWPTPSAARKASSAAPHERGGDPDIHLVQEAASPGLRGQPSLIASPRASSPLPRRSSDECFGPCPSPPLLPTLAWRAVCTLRDDLVADSGVVVLLDGQQIALFYVPAADGNPLYAIEKPRPEIRRQRVIDAGLVGHLGGSLQAFAALQAALPVGGWKVCSTRTVIAHLQARFNGDTVEIA